MGRRQSQAEVNTLMLLQTETAGRRGLHPRLNILIPTLDRAFKGEL